jgi:hypothetical protein
VNQIDTLTGFPQFQSGFQLGWILLPLVLLAGWWTPGRRSGRRSPWGLAGPAWVIGSLLALDGWGSHRTVVAVPGGLLLALAMLFAGAELAARTPNPKFIGFVLTLPGALLLATVRDLPGPGWVPVLVVVATTFGGPCAADVDRRAARSGLGPVLWLVTVIGVYATVPDTELIRPLVGVAIPLALAGWPFRVARLGAGGAAAGTGLLLWVAAIEGVGRPGSVVGAAGALGLLLVEPLGTKLLKRRVRPWSRSLTPAWFGVAFVAAHTAVVAWATRVAGMVDTGGAALAILVPGLVAGAAIGGKLGLSKRVRSTRRGSRRRQSRARRSHPSASTRR